ncbi:MAG TPA: class III extradiol ring-cleavage dioxygenase [Holophagaceae bacterium]|nr:class III extradiol ring-cleavage dioxygenase [Holophagaceae bacterium]
MPTMPCVFISHGSTRLMRESGAWSQAMAGWAAGLRPKAILSISAHWRTPKPTFTGARIPGVLHDFIGASDAHYALTYPARGNPELVLRALALLEDAGLSGDVDSHRPLDHGTWSPLRWMYPAADIPVVQMSLPQGTSPRALAELGLALAPLREDGVLLLGSGGLVHNPQRLRPEAAQPEGWAHAFDQWMARHLHAGNLPQAVTYRSSAPFAELAVPTPEHLDPLFAIWGAADGAPAEPLFEGWEQGNLSLRSVVWAA